MSKENEGKKKPYLGHSFLHQNDLNPGHLHLGDPGHQPELALTGGI